jgi:hypothetical protein
MIPRVLGPMDVSAVAPYARSYPDAATKNAVVIVSSLNILWLGAPGRGPRQTPLLRLLGWELPRRRETLLRQAEQPGWVCRLQQMALSAFDANLGKFSLSRRGDGTTPR